MVNVNNALRYVAAQYASAVIVEMDPRLSESVKAALHCDDIKSLAIQHHFSAMAVKGRAYSADHFVSFGAPTEIAVAVNMLRFELTVPSEYFNMHRTIKLIRAIRQTTEELEAKLLEATLKATLTAQENTVESGTNFLVVEL